LTGVLVGAARLGSQRHQHYSELLAYGEGLREDLHDLLRSRVGGYVVVGGLAAEQEVADASSGEVGLVSALAQSADDFGGVLFGVRHSAFSHQRSAISRATPTAVV
jgi:hypothetical protein